MDRESESQVLVSKFRARSDALQREMLELKSELERMVPRDEADEAAEAAETSRSEASRLRQVLERTAPQAALLAARNEHRRETGGSQGCDGDPREAASPSRRHPRASERVHGLAGMAPTAESV